VPVERDDADPLRPGQHVAQAVDHHLVEAELRHLLPTPLDHPRSSALSTDRNEIASAGAHLARVVKPAVRRVVQWLGLGEAVT